MHHPDHDASPFNALPPIVVVLVAIIGGVEIALQAGAAGLVGGAEAIGWRIQLIERFAFFDPVFEWMRAGGRWPLEGLMRFVTYPIVHYEIMHALFACVMILAIGKFVGERFSAAAVLVLFLASAAMGALGYGLLLNEDRQLIGAYPAIYGLLGAFTWTLFMGFGRSGENRLQAFRLIAVLMGLQLLFGLIGGGSGFDWVADLCGFATGFLLSFVLSPDGPARIRRWLEESRRR